MEQTFKNEVDEDMRMWVDQMDRRKAQVSGVPAKAEIKTEILHLTKGQFEQFKKNPQVYLERTLSGNNSANADNDSLFGT